MAHYVYAIAMEGDHPLMEAALKIGIAHDPSLRIGNMQTGSPFRLAIKNTWKFKSQGDALEFEQACHMEFSDRNIMREWFNVTVAEINEFYDLFFSIRDVDKEASDLMRAIKEFEGLDVGGLVAKPTYERSDNSNVPLTTNDAAAYIGVSASWLNKSRMTGTGPAYLKLGGKVRYAIQDLKNWLSANRRTAVYDHNNNKAA